MRAMINPLGWPSVGISFLSSGLFGFLLRRNDNRGNDKQGGMKKRVWEDKQCRIALLYCVTLAITNPLGWPSVGISFLSTSLVGFLLRRNDKPGVLTKGVEFMRRFLRNDKQGGMTNSVGWQKEWDCHFYNSNTKFLNWNAIQSSPSL